MKLRDHLYVYPWESVTENNCNSYYIKGAVQTLIDPGHLHLLGQLEANMARDGLSLDNVQLVISTHPHPDHCEGMLAFQGGPARTTMHETAEEFLREFSGQWEQMTGQEMPSFHMDFYLQQGQLTLGKETFQVIETPGHAPGSICLYWEEEKVLFTGDVIFNQSVGRVDLPGGNALKLAQSIDHLVSLDVDLLLPGHGPHIEGKGAVKENFYLIRNLLHQMI
jgi:glyoxylase-like metal-dependent hydrolase (beta-lactamase superfamily II)